MIVVIGCTLWFCICVVGPLVVAIVLNDEFVPTDYRNWTLSKRVKIAALWFTAITMSLVSVVALIHFIVTFRTG